MLAVYCANMAPPFVRFWPGWNPPISERYLGGHKTVIGFFFGIVVAVAVSFLQDRAQWTGNLISYDRWILLGVAAGLGAIAGDSLKSFFKRRFNIAPGHAWIPFDQLDFVFGGLLVLSFWYRFSWPDIFWILAFSFIADIIINHVSWYLRIRTTRW